MSNIKHIDGSGADRVSSGLPDFFVEGIDQVIEKDLQKAKTNVELATTDLASHKQALGYNISKKAHYKQLIKENKAGRNNYNMDSLLEARKLINVDLQAITNHIKYAEERIEHHGLIVKTLTGQLKEYKENYEKMKKAGLLKQA